LGAEPDAALIGSTVGVKSILFRPPYGIDHQPEYASEVSQLPIAQEMGYLIVGQKIDPHDWRQPYGKQVPAQEIIDACCARPTAEISFCFMTAAGIAAKRWRRFRKSSTNYARGGYFFVSVPEFDK